MQARIAAQQEAPDRHEYDHPRDAGRKPYETFQFLGLEEGMVALDVGAYAGYTSEMLAAAVGSSGTVFAHNTQRVLKRFAKGYYERTMTERLANERLPNTVLHVRDYDDLGLEGQVDVAFVGNLLHDFYYKYGRETAVRYLASMRRTLQPTGVLGIMDHVGIAGQDNGALHRLEPAIARSLIEEAGLEIVASSDLFANEADDHRLMVYDETIYRQTDRFFFKTRPAP